MGDGKAIMKTIKDFKVRHSARSEDIERNEALDQFKQSAIRDIKELQEKFNDKHAGINAIVEYIRHKFDIKDEELQTKGD